MNESITDWNGYKQINFTVGGRNSFIVCPKKPLAGNHWIWRTEFFGAFDYADRAMLEKGWYLAYHRVSDMYGCPESVAMMREFYGTAVDKYRLDPRPALFGFSRGGLYAVNFALANPSFVGALYLDAPVLDIRSWPGGKGIGTGEPSCWEECKKCYRLTEETAADFNDNPLDNTERLAATDIPVLLVCGAADRCVPYSENGEPFYRRFKAANGIIKKIIKPDCDHHPHSLSEPSPIVKFIETAVLKRGTPVFPEITANVIGDSITYGAYTGPDDDCPASVAEKPWCALVGERLGFAAVNNYGVSGTSVSSSSPVLPKSAFTLRYKDMNDSAELILVAGGTNDFGTSVSLGTPNDKTDISFYGGLNILCGGLKEKYPDATVVFITPINRNDKNSNDNGNTLEQYRSAIKAVAGVKYGFPIIDGAGSDFKNSPDALSADGVHPTPEGHRLMAENIATQLINILKAKKENTYENS